MSSFSITTKKEAMEELFVSCPHYFEEILLKELKSLGIEKLRMGFCGVYVPMKIENVYLINYCSRVATRVLWPLIRFACPTKEALYTMAKKVEWSRYLSTEKTFAIDANVSHPLLKNSLYASLVVKDAICDYFRDKVGERPSVNIQEPDVQLNLFIQKGQATLYIDTSLMPLHKRGWRLENTEATLHESIAAALLLRSGYTGDEILCDPFCGSGTFLIEAAMIASKTPPGFFRKKWGFTTLPDYSENQWLSFKASVDKQIVPLKSGQIYGADKDENTFKTAYRHIKATSFRGLIDLQHQDISSYHPAKTPQMVICNPPYGKRLELNKSVTEGLKRFIQGECAPATHILVLTSDPLFLKPLNMKTQEDISFKNGGLSVALYYIRTL